VRDCTGNYYGGAVSVYQFARLVGLNSTFARNGTTGHRGAIFTWPDSHVELTHCTLAENRADTDLSGDGKGGAIFLAAVAPGTEQFSQEATLVMRGCLSSQNTDQLAHTETNFSSRSRGIETAGASSAFTSGGGNFFSTIFDQGIGDQSDYVADAELGPTHWTPTAAQLLPLGNYGGPTLTYALCPLSHAAGLVTQGFAGTDQRGMPRGPATEAGAYAFAAETYDFWMTYTFPAGASRTGESDDYDGDGASNPVEQHTGTNALNAADHPTIVLNGVALDGSMNLTYPVSARVDAGALRLERSTQLQTWTTAVPIGLVTYSCVGAQQFVTFTVAGTGGGNPQRQFLRLGVVTN
jgi:hypothetical protein